MKKLIIVIGVILTVMLTFTSNVNAKKKDSQCADHGVSTGNIGAISCFYEGKTCTYFYDDLDNSGDYSRKDEINGGDCEIPVPPNL